MGPPPETSKCQPNKKAYKSLEYGIFRVKAPITDHLGDFALALEKYKAVQNFPL